MHVNAVLFQFVRKWLFHIKDMLINIRVVLMEAVENFNYVVRRMDRAIKIRAKPLDALGQTNPAHLYQSFIIPGGVCAPQFDLQTFQPIGFYPVLEQQGMTVVGTSACQIGRFQRIKPSYEMPGSQAVASLDRKSVLGIFAGEGDVRFGRREIAGEIPAHKPAIESLKDRTLVALAIGIMQRQIECGKTDQGRKPRHGFGAGTLLIQLAQYGGQQLLLKQMADFEGMTCNIELRKTVAEASAKIF